MALEVSQHDSADRSLFAASQAGLVNNPNDGMSWGILQTVTGPLSDRWGRKGLIAAGMWVQAVALVLYPTLIAAVSDASHPSPRARSLSVYRFWRDLGYAIGALCLDGRDRDVR